MALIGAMFVPVVSAVKDVNIIEKNYVSTDDAYKASLKALNLFLSAGAISDDNYSPQMLQKQPVEIYDLNGLIIYYQFPIEKNGKNEGFVRAAASKVLGSTVTMIKDRPDNVDYSSVLENTERVIQNKYSVKKDPDLKIVCYDYPELGVMYSFRDERDQFVKLIFDLEQNLITDVNTQTNGPGYYSLYNEINEDEIYTNIFKWNEEYDNELETKSTTYKDLWNSANHITQPNNVWCAVTTGKMIAYWFGVTDTFSHIAEEMNSGTPLDPLATSDTDDELDYYENSPTGLCCDAELKEGNQITFYTGMYQIYHDENPIASTVGNHSRACAGVLESSNGKYFHIYDPSSDGNIYWENFDSTTYLTWILVD